MTTKRNKTITKTQNNHRDTKDNCKETKEVKETRTIRRQKTTTKIGKQSQRDTECTTAMKRLPVTVIFNLKYYC